MNEYLSWWLINMRTLLTRFARPEIEHSQNEKPIEHYDKRLASLDMKQREIRARMQLLDMQANPRGKLYD